MDFKEVQTAFCGFNASIFVNEVMEQFELEKLMEQVSETATAEYQVS